jgi:hypothetical protein
MQDSINGRLADAKLNQDSINYGRALFIAVRPLCFTVIFMVAREQARAATIMFLRCFFVFLFYFFYFFLFFLFLFSLSRNL